MFRKSSYTTHEFYHGQHRFEHWYRDNTVYFITSRVRDGLPAFASPEAQTIFWDRLAHYCDKYGFKLWIATLMNNHYHLVGYLKTGDNLGKMMRQLHASVAKLVNDILEVQGTLRHLPFWREKGNKDYFDGCLRDELQAWRACRYTTRQSVRARLVKDWQLYPNTRLFLNIDRAIARATELKAYLYDVPYARYERRKRTLEKRWMGSGKRGG